MTVIDILKLVCEYVGEKEICAELKAQTSPSEAEQAKLSQMLDALNVVRQSIASDYMPFVYKEEINASNGILSYDSLTKTPIHIFEVKNKLGFNLRFKTYPNFIEIFGNAKSIVYSYLPEDLTLQSEVPLLNGIPASVYAFGTAAEYLGMEGINGEEVEYFDERFKSALFALTGKRGVFRLPQRTWR